MKNKPTSAELDILSILWKKGPSKVKKINYLLNEISKKKVGYTTTLKIMQIMTIKGLLFREKDGKSHIYSVAEEKELTQEFLLRNLIQTAFDGSKINLLMQLLGNSNSNTEELEEIHSFLNEVNTNKLKGN